MEKGDVKDDIYERVNYEQYSSCFQHSKEYCLWLAVEQNRV